MTDLEISKALALAIGWKPEQMQVAGVHNSLLICSEMATLTVQAYWRKFDYRDPLVIWPIAERYNCFPLRQRARSGGSALKWLAWDSLRAEYLADTAAKAVALAVIGGAK